MSLAILLHVDIDSLYLSLVYGLQSINGLVQATILADISNTLIFKFASTTHSRQKGP